jgi:hypothetical protein
MRAVIHVNQAGHQQQAGAAMKAGLARHRIAVSVGDYDNPEPCDFAVIWGAPAKHPRITQSAPHMLVMERGHLPDRMIYTSCGWDGLARRGRYPLATDWGMRWRPRWGDLMRPWRGTTGYALIIGQVEGDAALAGLGMQRWVKEQTDDLRAAGWDVRFRPHPLVARPERSLEADLTGAALCVTYNSTAGVEAVLAGVPTVTLDEGAMAWEVTSHAVPEIVRPAREAWAHALAWTSYTLEEVAAGLAWEHLAPVMEEAPCATA